MDDLPEAVVSELEALSAGPAPALVRWPRPGQLPAESYCALMDADPITLEQVTEYHVRKARCALQVYARRASPLLARKAARHVMISNLARTLFNRKWGQAEENDLPFPVADER